MDMFLDFNSGPPHWPGRIDATEGFCFHIDENLVLSRRNEKKRDYLGASELGNECDRALQFSYFNAPRDFEYSGRTLRIFQFGHVVEDLVIQWMGNAGFHMKTRGENGRQFEMSALGGRFKGHCDGVLMYGPKIDGVKYPCIWECKTMNTKKWQACKDKGVGYSHPDYLAQVALYQAYFQLTDNAVFTALNKDTCELYFELVPFNADIAQRASDRAVRIVNACEAGELLPRAYPKRTFYKCRWCDWQTRCWGKEE